MKFVFGLAVLSFLLVPLTGCNTVNGAGQDFKAAGEAISDTAEKTKHKMQ